MQDHSSDLGMKVMSIKLKGKNKQITTQENFHIKVNIGVQADVQSLPLTPMSPSLATTPK